MSDGGNGHARLGWTYGGRKRCGDVGEVNADAPVIVAQFLRSGDGGDRSRLDMGNWMKVSKELRAPVGKDITNSMDHPVACFMECSTDGFPAPASQQDGPVAKYFFLALVHHRPPSPHLKCSNPSFSFGRYDTCWFSARVIPRWLLGWLTWGPTEKTGRQSAKGVEISVPKHADALTGSARPSKDMVHHSAFKLDNLSQSNFFSRS